MSSSTSSNSSGSVRDLVAHFESLNGSADSRPPRTVLSALVADSVSDVVEGGNVDQQDWSLPLNHEDTGMELPGPNNTPIAVAAMLAFNGRDTLPVPPILTSEQAYGLIVHEALNPGARLTPVERYNLLVSLDPNSTDPLLAPLLEERRRRGIHLGRPRVPPPVLTSAQVLTRGINNNFVPSAPVTPVARTGFNPPTGPAGRGRGSNQGLTRFRTSNTWVRRDANGIPVSTIPQPFFNRQGQGRGRVSNFGRGQGRGRGRANTIDSLPPREAVRTPGAPRINTNDWPALGSAPVQTPVAPWGPRTPTTPAPPPARVPAPPPPARVDQPAPAANPGRLADVDWPALGTPTAPN